MEEAKIFGMKMSSAVTILCILVVLLIILTVSYTHLTLPTKLEV